MGKDREKQNTAPGLGGIYSGAGSFVNRTERSTEATSPGSDSTKVRIYAKDKGTQDLGIIMAIRAYNTTESDFTVTVSVIRGGETTLANADPLYQVINARNGEYLPIPQGAARVGAKTGDAVNILLDFASANRDFIIEGWNLAHSYA